MAKTSSMADPALVEAAAILGDAADKITHEYTGSPIAERR
jgi:hypothetical protein